MPDGSARLSTLSPKLDNARSSAPADGAQTSLPSFASVLPMIPGRTTTRSLTATVSLLACHVAVFLVRGVDAQLPCGRPDPLVPQGFRLDEAEKDLSDRAVEHVREQRWVRGKVVPLGQVVRRAHPS